MANPSALDACLEIADEMRAVADRKALMILGCEVETVSVEATTASWRRWTEDDVARFLSSPKNRLMTVFRGVIRRKYN